MTIIRNSFASSQENESLKKFSEDGIKLLLHNLQPREQEILQLHINGYTNEEIAKHLKITYNTVKNNIYESKLKIRKLWKYFFN